MNWKWKVVIGAAALVYGWLVIRGLNELLKLLTIGG